MVKTKDLKDLVATIIAETIGKYREEFEFKLRERTGKLHDSLDNMLIENEKLRETIHKQDKMIREINSIVQENTHKANLALKQSNYNEQYSRKCR